MSKSKYEKWLQSHQEIETPPTPVSERKANMQALVFLAFYGLLLVLLLIGGHEFGHTALGVALNIIFGPLGLYFELLTEHHWVVSIIGLLLLPFALGLYFALLLLSAFAILAGLVLAGAYVVIVGM